LCAHLFLVQEEFSTAIAERADLVWRVEDMEGGA
jgi:hypothetical protein